MIIEEKAYWVWLTLIQNLGSRRIINLLNKYKKPERIWNLTKEQLMYVDGIGEKIAENITNNEIKKCVNYHLKYIKQHNIKIITINDKLYPKLLKDIYDPPVVLYVLGNEKILNDVSIAIIGCRECTKYGENMAKYFAYNLSKRGVNVVSGLAKGIDSYAHIGTIYAKSKTIAVLGNGLDMIYPKENEIIANKIIELGGCILSEYPIGTKPEKVNFPARNRIISGLSNGIIVVEAKKKSGTMITVDFALEQGRDVFVVPGNITSLNSVGTNELIRQGATLVTNYEQVLEEMLIDGYSK